MVVAGMMAIVAMAMPVMVAVMTTMVVAAVVVVTAVVVVVMPMAMAPVVVVVIRIPWMGQGRRSKCHGSRCNRRQQPAAYRGHEWVSSNFWRELLTTLGNAS